MSKNTPIHLTRVSVTWSFNNASSTLIEEIDGGTNLPHGLQFEGVVAFSQISNG